MLKLAQKLAQSPLPLWKPRRAKTKKSLQNQARKEMPPEGQQQTLISAGNTLVLAIVVAESAAKHAYFDSERPQATACDAEPMRAIDAWIVNCPVVLPEAMTLGIRAMVLAASVRQ